MQNEALLPNRPFGDSEIEKCSVNFLLDLNLAHVRRNNRSNRLCPIFRFFRYICPCQRYFVCKTLPCISFQRVFYNVTVLIRILLQYLTKNVWNPGQELVNIKRTLAWHAFWPNKTDTKIPSLRASRPVDRCFWIRYSLSINQWWAPNFWNFRPGRYLGLS